MGNLRMNADQISYKGGNKPMSVEEAIKNAGNTGLAHTADIAPDFSTESAYSAGDYVYHNGTLYVFTSNHAAGAWSTSDTQVVTVGGEITTLTGEAADLYSGKANQITIAPFFSAEASYDPGDLVYYNGLSYRCVNAHEGEWDADDFAATTVANELSALMSGLNGLGTFVLLAHEEMPIASQWNPIQDISINVNAYRFFGVRLTHASDTINGTPLCLFSREEFLASDASKPLCALFNATELNDAYNVYVHYNEVSVTPLFYFRGDNVSDTLYLTIFGIV